MDKIAIVGIVGVYPDADCPEKLFENLLLGKSSIKRLTNSELAKSGISKDTYMNKNYRPFGTVLAGYKKFDSAFFKMTPHESEMTDPQQRIFLNCAYQCLQDAGYNPFKCKETVGVFGSQGANTYLQKNIIPSKYYSPSEYQYPVVLGNDVDSLATRVSYKLNLTGPSLTIQSGCSSSLVGLNYAVKSVKFGDCDMALVGGVHIWLPSPSGYHFISGSTFSNTGKVSPFDEKADGMILGSGCSVIAIKKLSSAIEDKNHIYALIDGIGINNDGSGKVGYTAPSVKGQVGAITKALSKANISADQVEYIEAHGTGTHIGNPIEFRALKKVYGNMRAITPKNIGSIKANIGHLDAAAGITGLMKDVLILSHKEIPKQINFSTANKNIALSDNGFSIETANKPLSDDKHYVAVTSLGIGGTNVHVILSSYQSNLTTPQNRISDQYLFLMSASTSAYLKQQAIMLLNYVENNEKVQLVDISYTMFKRLGHGSKRLCLKANNSDTLKRKLREYILDLTIPTPDKITEKFIKTGNVSDIKNKIYEGKLISLPTTRFLGEKAWIDSKSVSNKLKEMKKNQSVHQTLRVVIDAWSNNIGKSVSPNDTFESVSGESIIAVSIAGQISRELDLNVNPNILERYNTPKKLADYLDKPEKKPSNIISLHKGSGVKKLFLIHPAGGSIFCYEKLLQGIETNIDIYGISYPDNIDDDKTISDLASLYADQIQSVSNNSEIILGGYSFGGNESIAVAEELKKIGVKVRQVILIDSIVPDAYFKSAIPDEQYINRFPDIWRFITASARNKDISSQKFEGLTQAIDWSRDHGVIDSKAPDAMVERMFKVWTSNHKVLANQHLLRNEDLSIFLFYATEKLSPSLYSFTKMDPYQANDWKKYCKSLDIENIQGIHYSIFGENLDFRAFQKAFFNLLRKLSNKEEEA